MNPENFPQLISYKNDSEFAELLMSFEGESLEQILNNEYKSKIFNWPLAEKIFFEVLKALKNCFDLGIIHGDLKPGNICIKGMSEYSSKHENLKISLIDFGLANHYTHL
jgi:serine/threonine protein kinase